LISVVITTFGNQKNLQQALTTVFNQEYKDFEVIVVDGKNDKKLIDTINKFDSSKVTYLGLENDKGVVFARNIGCQKADGKYIAMLDDDDEWTSDKLQKQVNSFDNNIGIVTCYTSIVCDDNSKFNAIQKPLLNPSYADLLKGFQVSPTSSFLVDREAMKSVGYFSEMLIYPEYDLALKMRKKGYQIKCVPEILMIYHKISKQKKMYSKKQINVIRVIELINFLKIYQKDFFVFLKGKDLIYNFIRCFGLFFVLGFGGIFNQNTELILEKIKYFIERDS
jgi:glycosyltransferase involved in cell wall biosynthesis